MDTVYYERTLGLFEHFMFGACSTYKLSAESLTWVLHTILYPERLWTLKDIYLKDIAKKEFAFTARRSLFRRGRGKAVIEFNAFDWMYAIHWQVKSENMEAKVARNGVLCTITELKTA